MKTFLFVKFWPWKLAGVAKGEAFEDAKDLRLGGVNGDADIDGDGRAACEYEIEWRWGVTGMLALSFCSLSTLLVVVNRDTHQTFHVNFVPRSGCSESGFD